MLDRDLPYLANALWAGGAEAVAINGQRLTATTTIRSAGRAILVDFRPVMGPYEVAAIGPDDLDRRFDDSAAAGLFRRLESRYGMPYEVRRAEDLTLPGAAEPRLRFARPADADGSTPAPTPAPTVSGSGPVPSGAVPTTSPPGGGP